MQSIRTSAARCGVVRYRWLLLTEDKHFSRKNDGFPFCHSSLHQSNWITNFLENVCLYPKPGGKVRLDSDVSWPLKIVMYCIVLRSFAHFEMISECWSPLPEYLNATVVWKCSSAPDLPLIPERSSVWVECALSWKSVHCGYCGINEVSVNELSRENRFDFWQKLQ